MSMTNPYLPSVAASSPSRYYPSNGGTGVNSASASSSSQPISRSRTLFYLSVRDSSSLPRHGIRAGRGYGETIDVADEENVGLIGQDGRTRVDMAALPPKWVDLSDEVEEILGRLNGKVAALDKLHAKHVLPGFTDRTAEEREIERHTTDITRDFRRCSALVSAIQPGRGAARVELVTAKNVQRGLAQKVQEMSGQFRKKQRVYMQKLQGHAIKNKDLLAASGAITLRGPDSFDELAEDEAASRTQLQSQATTTATLDLDIVQRTNEITQIASSISELADLFRDLGNLVVEQGTVLDSVEYNVEITAKELSNAVDELHVAEKYQSRTGKRKCILLLILIIVGLIIVLIYKPRRHGTSGSPEATSSSTQSVGLGDAIVTASSATAHSRPKSGSSTRHRPSATRRPSRPRPTRSSGLPRPAPLPTNERRA